MGNETRVKQPWVLILAGGSGTRFWPASRRANPKHVLPGLGGEGRSLLQATIDRVLPLTRPERVFVLTSADQAKIVRPHMEALAPESSNVFRSLGVILPLDLYKSMNTMGALFCRPLIFCLFGFWWPFK